MTTIPDAARALAIMAHPDDADFGAGGTLATWADEGFEVTLVVCTRGDQGGLEPTWELQRDLVRMLRQVRPHRVLHQSPERWYERLYASHPDHLAAGEAAIRAIYPAAENPHAWPELVQEEELPAFRVPEIWLMAHPWPNHAVDITDVVDRKIAALRAHESQTGHMDGLEGLVRSWGAAFAEQAGLPVGRLAELFKRIVIT